MGRKRRACARAARVAAVVALAAAALFARERIGARGAVSPGSDETGARGSTSASAGLASRVPIADADASDVDEAVVSPPTADEAATRAGDAARVPITVTLSRSAIPSRSEDRVAERREPHDSKTPPSPRTEGTPRSEKRNAEKDVVTKRRVARLDAADAARRYGFAPNTFIAATFATIEVVDMLRNWVEHAVFVANFADVAIVALDEATLDACADGAFEREATVPVAAARVVTCVDATGAFHDPDALRVRANEQGPLIGHRENKRAFNQIGIVKTRVISALLEASLTVLMSDVDVVWLRDPSRYLRSGQARRAHVAVSSDCVFGFEPGRPETDAFGQRPSPNNAELNTGVLLLRPTKATLALVERWTASQLAAAERHEMNDQSHFNAVVNARGGRREVLENDGVYAWDDEADAEVAATIVDGADAADRTVGGGFSNVSDRELFPDEHERGLRPRYYETANLDSSDTSDVRSDETKRRGSASSGPRARLALLPTGLFSNGHTFFVSRLAERSGVTPFAVHNTYQYSGTAGKIARFRENGLWAVDDAAYFGVADEGANETDAERGRRFLMLKYDVPGALADPEPSLRTPKGGTPSNHVALMTYQVNRVRDGLALASALNRTLIMPPLLSTCDRWFNLLPNCTQGDARVPMVAPLDHAFLVFALDAFGGGGKYVENRFLSNRARFLRGESAAIANDETSTTRDEEEEASLTAFGLGPVARLEFRDAPGRDGKHKTPTDDRRPFRVPEDFAAIPGYAPPDAATARAVAAVKRGAPRYFSAAFGSVASEVRATLGAGGDVDAVRLLVVENVRPGAFAGFGAADENAAFHEAMTPLVHEWCCRRNGTVPHLPTPYGEEETYAYARER